MKSNKYFPDTEKKLYMPETHLRFPHIIHTSSPMSYISLTSPGSSVPSDSFPGPVPISDRPAERVTRQPVQTVVGQRSNASYEAIHFSDPLVRAMIDADMNNMQ
ncbi:unnamed protein product [Acanthoscelides obtectus]|uniref:Uncharacterized protein n=1 Tax=Acanthoscelides obtectus TaxID=200917 RepID=A0A9P0PM19_ACAOB|nr:unnamed protein product [Acanthoscelides obtectus]CAK1640525.1 hypothetical protein AOBTE_LOCUS11777 [Acanthoscelides obtectus]